MTTETGAEKRHLSRSSIENEEVATEISNEDFDSSKKCNTPAQPDEQKQSFDEKERKEEYKATIPGSSSRDKENSVATPTNIENTVIPGDGSRQIIAVSANKNPTAFFQLARKFLMTNEMCDLSALEGAIVSAVDAAHLLERSKLASIVRIHTSYVNVEPKRRRNVSQQKVLSRSTVVTDDISSPIIAVGLHSSKEESSPLTRRENAEERPEKLSPSVSSSIADSKKSITFSKLNQGGQQQSLSSSSTRNLESSLSGSSNRELRRARILVTVKRTESYKRWLEENPTQCQSIVAGTATLVAQDTVGSTGSTNGNICSTHMCARMEQRSQF